MIQSEERFTTRDGLNALDREDWDTLSRFLSLSPREQEVAMLMARGLSRVEMADVLFVTRGTVRNHINRIYAVFHLDALVSAGRTGGSARIELAWRFMCLGTAISRTTDEVESHDSQRVLVVRGRRVAHQEWTAGE